MARYGEIKHPLIVWKERAINAWCVLVIAIIAGAIYFHF